MTLKIERLHVASGGGLIAHRRLYLTADKTRVVEEGSPDAAWLFAVPGTEIAGADVARYGLAPVPEKAQPVVVAPEPEPPKTRKTKDG